MLKSKSYFVRTIRKCILYAYRIAIAFVVFNFTCAHAETVKFGDAVTVDFPTQSSIAKFPGLTGFELRQSATDGKQKALFIATRADLPFWWKLIVLRAPDFLSSDCASGGFRDAIETALPGAVVVGQMPFQVNGYQGIQFELNRGPDTTESFGKDLNHFSGRFVAIEGNLYLFAIADRAEQPLAPAVADRFFASFRPLNRHTPGDPDEQLGTLVMGFIAGALLLLIALVVFGVVLVRRYRRRARERGRIQPSPS